MEGEKNAAGSAGAPSGMQLDLRAGIWLVAVLSTAQLVSQFLRSAISVIAVSYTHLTLPTILRV